MLKYVSLSEIDDLFAGCIGGEIILAWKNRAENDTATRLFVGRYLRQDDAIYSREERFLIMQTEFIITSGAFNRVTDKIEDFSFYWLDFLSL